MKIVIAGGGTGGHLFPGLAIAEEFRRRDAGAEVSFVGTEHGIESRIIPREGYPLHVLRAEGIVGKTFMKRLTGAAKMALTFMDAAGILKKLSPDIVIGVGGYASGVLVLSASLKAIPTLIHEQNSVPGTTNRILGRFVDRICVTYQESMSVFPLEKTFLSGNPVRMKLMKGERESAGKLFSLEKDVFTVFVFGGSSGATSINRTVVDALNHLGDFKGKLQFLHQTGDRDFEGIREAYRKAGVRATVAPFIFQMAEAYAASDLVVSRAGATTLAELTGLGKPAILVPYPHAAGRHQEFNALKLKEMGAAQVLFEQDMTGPVLASMITEMAANPDGLREMQRASRGLGRPEAGVKIVDLALGLFHNRKMPGKVGANV